ncbi:MAG: hypothetical protein ACRDLC_00735, partial [Actinomycetota bacterium]
MVGAGAGHVLQDDAGVLEPQHPATLLVDDLLDPPQHPGFPAAVPHHLAVERHAAVGVVRVERPDNLLLALDPDQLAGLQAERLSRGVVEGAFDERVPPAVSDP